MRPMWPPLESVLRCLGQGQRTCPVPCSVSHDWRLVRVVMQCRGKLRTFLQLVILQPEFLGHFSPVLRIKEVVRASLKWVCLYLGFQTRHPGHPDQLLFVIPPVPIMTEKDKKGNDHKLKTSLRRALLLHNKCLFLFNDIIVLVRD